MVLSEFLYPGEGIIFQSNKIESLNDNFFFFITDQRILLYRRRGVLFKKDRVIAERLEDVRSMQYGEMGIVRRKGILRIETYSKKMDPIVGKVADIKAIWQEMQKYIKKDPQAY
jgi:ribosomal protein S3